MKRYIFIFAIFAHFITVLNAQIWEADVTKIGQSQAGGFDYQWKNFTSAEVGTRTWTFDYTGVRSLKHAPAVGVHPRIFFNPEDTSEIRIRLNTTINGIQTLREARGAAPLYLWHGLGNRWRSQNTCCSTN